MNARPQFFLRSHVEVSAFQPSLRSLAAITIASALIATGVANPIKTSTSEKPSKVSKVKRPALYMVGYSHLDTEWCWSYPQVIREFIPNTLHENFALFKQFPDYVFNWTGSNRYRFMKEYYPADYALLKKYIAQGRWFPAGSSVEEGDVNSPSEESLVRQVLYGNEFFHKEFGVQSEEFMLPDCFGFPASLPSILAHCGLKGFSTQKLTWGSPIGIPFNVGKWIGPDGRSIVAALNPESYTSDVKSNLATDPRWVSRLQRDEVKDGVGVDYHYFGVGDRGGAPDSTSVKFVDESTKSSGPIHVFSGRADQMFNDLTPEDLSKLPTYQGDLELTQHSAGSLTSETAQKRWNRKNELLGAATEAASVAADWMGVASYDKARITDAWTRFLPGQFHDLMAGTALPAAYTYAWNDQVIAMNEFADVLQDSVGGVAKSLDTRSKGIPLVIYNPLSINRADIVESEVRFPGSVPLSVQVFSPSSRPVPTQVLSREAHSLRICFVAKVPSLGFAVYDVGSASAPVASTSLKISKSGLENERYSVKIDQAGDVSSVFDKINQKELLSGPARLAYQYENPGEYPAWNMDWNDQKQKPREYVTGAPTVEIVENGPVRVALRITRRHKGSKFVQTLRLGLGESGERLDFVTQIDWQGRESALKAEFPLTVRNEKATYNWGLGTIQRETDGPKRYEMASHGWIDLTDQDQSYGASILDDSKYGSDKPDDHTLRLTLIYTPGVRGGYQHQATQDWGRNRMTYALLGHPKSWTSGNTQWQSAALNQPLLAFQTDSHSGSNGKIFSLASSSTPKVSLEAVKQAEANGEVIVRLNELAGEEHKNVQIKFAGSIVSAREVDGQERTIGAAKVVDGVLTLDAHPYEPRAFALRLSKPSTSLAEVRSQALSLPFNLTGISSGFGKQDASFDRGGNSIPGDMLPGRLKMDGVEFVTGPKGKQNLLVADGQTLRLPAGTNRKLVLLGSSAGSDSSVELNFGSTRKEVPLQAWNGAIGQWDSREWGGAVPELAYDWHNPMVGLEPGFIKRQPVAWYADHTRKPDGSEEIYAFCYLFKAEVSIPDDATEVTLGKNAESRIAAISVATQTHDNLTPGQPLYDVLDHPNVDGPRISTISPIPNAEQIVTIDHPLYWSPESPIHYTLDGTTPGLQSPTYLHPFPIGSSCTVTAASIDPSGKVLNGAKREITVIDTVPPSLVKATRLQGDGFEMFKVEFSEPVNQASAEDASHYHASSGSVTGAKLSDDGKVVTLMVTGTDGSSQTLFVHGVKDAGSLACDSSLEVKPIEPVYQLAAPLSLNGTGEGFRKELSGLPTGATDAWTINLFVKLKRAPKDLTVLAGFGDGEDNNGAERFIIAQKGHVYFWGSSIDIDSGVDYDLNRWQMVTASYDGKVVRVFKDGKQIGMEAAQLENALNMVRIGPRSPWEYGHQFEGEIGGVTIWNEALPEAMIRALVRTGGKGF